MYFVQDSAQMAATAAVGRAEHDQRGTPGFLEALVEAELVESGQFVRQVGVVIA